MKLFLPKLTAMAMVATTSSADALQWPSWTSLRGSDNYVKVKGTDCENGYDDGVAETQQLWRGSPNRSNCDNIWGFQGQADEMKDDEFPANPNNWRDQTYNDCARNGVDDEVNNIEKGCTWDDTTQCNDLGNAAAQRIVMRDFCSPGRGASQQSVGPNWKAICADEAVGICRGNIGNTANKWCPDKTLSGSDLNSMRNQCNDEVDDMVGNDVRRPPTARPTPRPTARPTPRPNPNPNRRPPTARPTRRPTRRPTPRPNSPNPRPPTDRDERCGREGKCGNCKQEFCPDVQERKACKAEHCSFEEELANAEIN